MLKEKSMEGKKREKERAKREKTKFYKQKINLFLFRVYIEAGGGKCYNKKARRDKKWK